MCNKKKKGQAFRTTILTYVRNLYEKVHVIINIPLAIYSSCVFSRFWSNVLATLMTGRILGCLVLSSIHRLFQCKLYSSFHNSCCGLHRSVPSVREPRPDRFKPTLSLRPVVTGTPICFSAIHCSSDSETYSSFFVSIFTIFHLFKLFVPIFVFLFHFF